MSSLPVADDRQMLASRTGGGRMLESEIKASQAEAPAALPPTPY
jgi:hypothetical protein